MKVELFFGQPVLALVCGYCPNRRVLDHLAPMGQVLVPVGGGQRQARPSAAFPPEVDRTIDGQPYRQRCKKGHRWEFQPADLLAAYQRAITNAQRDIVAGVDVT
jgi:hypothetical protein